jgi:hypothetical protein
LAFIDDSVALEGADVVIERLVGVHRDLAQRVHSAFGRIDRLLN